MKLRNSRKRMGKRYRSTMFITDEANLWQAMRLRASEDGGAARRLLAAIRNE